MSDGGSVFQYVGEQKFLRVLDGEIYVSCTMNVQHSLSLIALTMSSVRISDEAICDESEWKSKVTIAQVDSGRMDRRGNISAYARIFCLRVSNVEQDTHMSVLESGKDLYIILNFIY